MSAALQTVHLRQAQDFQFDVTFGSTLPPLRTDEPPPLGQGLGPTPVQMLAAAVGDCLSASLLFALRKFKQAPEPLACEVNAEVGRNADGRMRVLSMTATLTLGVPAASPGACRALGWACAGVSSGASVGVGEAWVGTHNEPTTTDGTGNHPGPKG